MAPIALAVSALLAVVMGLVAAPVLRLLPAPAEEPLLRFADLVTPRFRLLLGAATMAAGAACLLTTGTRLWPVWVPLVAIGPLLGLVDAQTCFLPLRLNYLALALVAVGVVVSCWLRDDWRPAVVAVAGGAVATGCYWLLWRLSGGQLGFGDVRLAGLLGVATGATSPGVLVWSFVLGSLIGAVWAVVVRLAFRRREFPYGPSMLLGPPVALVAAVLLDTGTPLGG